MLHQSSIGGTETLIGEGGNEKQVIEFVWPNESLLSFEYAYIGLTKNNL